MNTGCTYDGINGGGNVPPGRPPGTGGLPPPGRFGMAGAARDVAGGGGGPRLVPYLSNGIIASSIQVV